MNGGYLGQVITGRVDEGVDAFARGLVEGAADLKVEGRNCIVGRCNEVVEISFCHIFHKVFAFLWQNVSLEWASGDCLVRRWVPTSDPKDRGYNWLCLIKGEDGASNEGLEESPVGIAILVICTFCHDEAVWLPVVVVLLHGSHHILVYNIISFFDGSDAKVALRGTRLGQASHSEPSASTIIPGAQRDSSRLSCEFALLSSP